MNQPLAETVWQVLTQDLIGLHFARFSLFLFLGIPVEIYCAKRSPCPACSFPTIFLQLLVGISGVLVTFFLYTSVFELGERAPTPFWYFPITGSILATAIAIFSIGMIDQLSSRQFLTASLRFIMFVLTVGFAVKLIMTPIEINRELNELEKTGAFFSASRSDRSYGQGEIRALNRLSGRFATP